MLGRGFRKKWSRALLWWMSQGISTSLSRESCENHDFFPVKIRDRGSLPLCEHSLNPKTPLRRVETSLEWCDCKTGGVCKRSQRDARTDSVEKYAYCCRITNRNSKTCRSRFLPRIEEWCHRWRHRFEWGILLLCPNSSRCCSSTKSACWYLWI